MNHLQQNDRLRTAALGHSQSMTDNNFFSHTTLSGSNGATFSDRITDAGYNWNAAGENIAGGQGRDFTSGVNQMGATDAARDVMYGTTEFTSINAFFSDNFGISASGWGELGNGLTGEVWDSWQANQKGAGGWMGSSGHRHNIRNDMFDDLGVGYVWEPTDSPPILLDGGNTIALLPVIR
ncbi:MAG: hypothetical protein KZQ90_01165 [Candidatus Thiodiazotropha sp. (ex Codakia rugifera)]|nr:hypothetical protein [Candidatus Thiodiazotropha sp. (ex Codakia rugifera)]